MARQRDGGVTLKYMKYMIPVVILEKIIFILMLLCTYETKHGVIIKTMITDFETDHFRFYLLYKTRLGSAQLETASSHHHIQEFNFYA